MPAAFNFKTRATNKDAFMPKARKNLSKKLRFDVFKRDIFTCQYCGSVPPKVVLEVDHVHPVSKGGDNDIDNLITSCFDCNRGKAANSLEVIPQTVAEKTALMVEKEDQLKELRAIKKRKKNRLSRDINHLDEIYQEHFPDYAFSQSFKNSIRNQFLPNLDVDTLENNLTLSCNKCWFNSRKALKYFCGVNWRQIKECPSE